MEDKFKFSFAFLFSRVGYGKFDVDQIDPDLCTHGFYGFSELNNQTWEMVPVDPWYRLKLNQSICSIYNM